MAWSVVGFPFSRWPGQWSAINFWFGQWSGQWLMVVINVVRGRCSAFLLASGRFLFLRMVGGQCLDQYMVGGRCSMVSGLSVVEGSFNLVLTKGEGNDS